MVVGLVFLLGIDATLALAAVLAMRRSWSGTSDGVPLLWSLIMTMAAIFLHSLGVSVLGYFDFSETGMRSPQLTAGMSVAGGVVPALLYGWMLIGSVANAFAGGHREPAPVSRDALNRALNLEQKGDIEGALAECRAIAATFPGFAPPLLEQARILDLAERYQEAAEACRIVMRTFRKGDEAWTAAASRLHLLLRDQLGERDAANKLRQEMGERRRRGPASRRQVRTTSSGLTQQPLEGQPDDVTLEQYRRRYRVDPANPRPLFGAVTVLERTGRTDECADMLRFIMQTFEKDKSVWSDAAYRLGLLLEHQIGADAAAAKVYREIIQKRPDLQRRRLAHERLTALEERGGAPEKRD